LATDSAGFSQRDQGEGGGQDGRAHRAADQGGEGEYREGERRGCLQAGRDPEGV